MKEIFVDVSEMPSPEPFFFISEKLDEIIKGIYMVVQHRMKPKLLFSKLRKKQLQYEIYPTKKNNLLLIYIYHLSDQLMIDEIIKKDKRIQLL